MDRGRAGLFTLALVTLTGCAAAPPAARAQAHTTADLEDWVVAAAPTSGPASRTLSPLAAGPVHIPAPPPVELRPRKSAQVDVRFQRADLKQAFQFLAESDTPGRAGGLGDRDRSKRSVCGPLTSGLNAGAASAARFQGPPEGGRSDQNRRI
jgi:hypothetical protein